MWIKKGSLIVSCQATEGEPLYGYDIMHLMANACVQGGAKAIRASGVKDINKIMQTVDVPMIGLIKRVYADSNVYITPTLREVKELLEETDTQVIAIDATNRIRPNKESLSQLVRYIRHNKPNVEIMADIATLAEAKEAEKLGVDYISSTLRGYTKETANINIPDILFLKELTKKLNTKIIAEGGIWEKGQLQQIINVGVYAVVIGSAITRPKDITMRFNAVLENFYE